MSKLCLYTSGWNCTPCKCLYSLWEIAIIVESSKVAVMSKQDGKEIESTIRLWYLVATNGVSISLNNPFWLWNILDVLPCISSLPTITLPPKAWANAWCPKQTPNIGIFLDKFFSIGRQIPDWSGLPGPGDNRCH